ncbi:MULTISPECIES: hypothetical protein [unclassified Streptomyces]|uniref:hypothetical protein n=1 Tax=unclassified Streptomyces TaxID=2593676 RepID=UPI00278C4606|nr:MULTISPECIES: hypothetical protein [unclassified Streptomyces]
MPTVLHPPTPTPANPHPLTLTVTLPATPSSAGIARSAASAALHRYGLGRFTPVTVLAVTELAACAARTVPGTNMRIELAQYEGGLRITSLNTHPMSGTGRGGLWLLSTAVEDWGGNWGVLHTHSPTTRSLTWIDLPH